MSFAPNSQLPYGAEYYSLGHNSCLFPGKLLPYLFWDQDPLCRLGGERERERSWGVGWGGRKGGKKEKLLWQGATVASSPCPSKPQFYRLHFFFFSFFFFCPSQQVGPGAWPAFNCPIPQEAREKALGRESCHLGLLFRSRRQRKALRWKEPGTIFASSPLDRCLHPSPPIHPPPPPPRPRRRPAFASPPTGSEKSVILPARKASICGPKEWARFLFLSRKLRHFTARSRLP